MKKAPKRYLNSDIRELIEETIHSERDRQILCRRLIDGIGFERLGEEFSLTDRQVKRIVYKLQEELFLHV